MKYFPYQFVFFFGDQVHEDEDLVQTKKSKNMSARNIPTYIFPGYSPRETI